MTERTGAGGFIPYLSPPPSSIASTTNATTLPHPRSTPLKPGGTKESRLIRHIDTRLLHIQRRFAKRHPSGNDGIGIREADEQGRIIQEQQHPIANNDTEKWNDVQGYPNFAHAATDIEDLLALIWLSGTPALQIPYLISIALLTTTIIPYFAVSPRSLFRLLKKLDHAFASLLLERDVETHEPLPGFNTNAGRRGAVSVTEKVRIKSLVERTRVSVVEAMNRGEFEEGDDEEDQESRASTPENTDVDMDDGNDGGLVLDNEPQDINVDDMDDEDDDFWNMQMAKVYDKTLVELGDSMDGPEIGYRTEPTVGGSSITHT